MIAAIVPAAGRSERMGRPKLILPIAGRTVIAKVVTALIEGGADPVIVVAPPAEVEGADSIAREAEACGAVVRVLDSPTADMRATVVSGMALLRRSRELEALMLAPGDSPGITPGLVAEVIRRWREDPTRIVVPSLRGRRGHPVLFPRAIADAIETLPEGVGVNRILEDHALLVVEVETESAGMLMDLDTPEDYRNYLSASGELGGP